MTTSKLVGKMIKPTPSLLDIEELEALPCHAVGKSSPQAVPQTTTGTNGKSTTKRVENPLWKSVSELFADIEKSREKERELRQMIDMIYMKTGSRLGGNEASDTEDQMKPAETKQGAVADDINIMTEPKINQQVSSAADELGQLKVRKRAYNGKFNEEQKFLASKRYKMMADDNISQQLKAQKRAQKSMEYKRCKLPAAKSDVELERKRHKKQVYVFKQELYKHLVQELNSKKCDSETSSNPDIIDMHPLTHFMCVMFVILMTMLFAYWFYISCPFL